MRNGIKASHSSDMANTVTIDFPIISYSSNPFQSPNFYYPQQYTPPPTPLHQYTPPLTPQYVYPQIQPSPEPPYQFYSTPQTPSIYTSPMLISDTTKCFLHQLDNKVIQLDAKLAQISIIIEKKNRVTYLSNLVHDNASEGNLEVCEDGNLYQRSMEVEGLANLSNPVKEMSTNKDTLICKSILNEYSMKMKAEKPVYNSETAYGLPPTFVTSLTFNGRQYVGAKGRSIKESQQLAARAVILSILDSDARTVISKIIIKWRLSSAKEKVKFSCNTQNEVMPEGIQTESNVGTSVSDGNRLDDNMPRAAISEPIENSTSVSAISVPLHEFRLPKEEASVVESNGTPVIYAPPNLEQPAIKSTWVEKGKRNSTITKNDVGICAQVQIAAVPSSQTSTVPQSVPDKCVPLRGFDNAVSPGPCVLPKLGSGPETHIQVYWRKPAEGFYALNTDGAFKNDIAAGGGILRNHFGEHIFNFYNNYGSGSIIIAESKAILDGLSICKELGYNKIQIQTDSLQATLCFGRKSKNPLSLQIIWDEIYKFQDTMSIEIMHVYREGNKMADYLSKKGILAKGMGAINMSLDERAKEILTGEKLGISYLKKLKNQFAEGVRENFMHTGVQSSEVSSSQISTCTVAQSVHNNCVSVLQVAGATLKEIVQTGNMISERALSLLVKRGSRPVVAIAPREEGADKNAVLDLEKEIGDPVKNVREKKKSKHDKEHHCSKKHLQGPKCAEDAVAENTLVTGSTSQNVELGSDALVERPKSIMIEIGPEARWNLGDQQPLQVFGAFRLAKDASSYSGFSREEIVMRSRRRLGMFISDYEELLNGFDEEMKESHEREVAGLKKELSDANHKLCDWVSRGEEASKKLDVEEKGRATDKEKFDKQILELEEELSRCRLQRDEAQKARDEADASNIALVNEVAALKVSLAKSDDKLVQSLEGGYYACLGRLISAGVDGTGHSFEDYCVELGKEQAAGGGDEAS